MDSNQPQLLVYKASAGSGKTFTLAVQYIRQLIEDPMAYRKILAVTFTNKATAEMKKRILTQLYGIATADSASDGYVNEIVKATGKRVEQIRIAAETALRNLIHDYSRFRIETIDSFFQSVLRNLARELEIGTNMNIELNYGEVLSNAVDSMIEKLDRKSPVLVWLLEYIEEKIADDKKWDVLSEVKSFGKNIFNEIYVDKGNSLHKKLEDPKFIPQFKKEVRDLQKMALEQMAGYGRQFEQLLQSHGLEVDQLTRKKTGISSYFKKISEGKLTDDIRNVTVESHLNDAESWAPKSGAKRNLVIDAATSCLMPLLQEAEQKRPLMNRIVNSCQLTLQHINSLRLLDHIDREMKQANRAHNRFLLSDTNALLHGLMTRGDASFVYEKIGTTIDTVMIDEFQDTSGMQWENFHLLLEESLSHKDGSMIVGDIKQSIYRWRNGDWKILANIHNDAAFNINEQTLDTNWRSEENIIRFNNAIFTAATQVLDEWHQQENKCPCEELENAYRDVCQLPAKQTGKGYVRMNFVDSAADDYKEATLQLLVDEVERLKQEGVTTSDIAILVRKNKTIPVIADYFEKHSEVRIVSDDAFRFDASLAINMVIDAIRILIAPHDRNATARLAVAYQNEVLRRDVELNALLLINDLDSCLPAEFQLMRHEMRLMPLYELIEKIISIFRIGDIGKQDAYLFAFFDAVTDYIQTNSSELTDFVKYWDDTLFAKTIPSGEMEGIRILSIHKSKGLEYHTVLLPFFDWKLENETNSHLVWCDMDDTKGVDPFRALDIVPVNYSIKMQESIYRKAYLNERLQLWVDNLNLLYVAFTRACSNLVIWCKKDAKNTVSELLQLSADRVHDFSLAVSADGDDEADEGSLLIYEYGELCPSVERAEKKSANRLDPPVSALPVSMESIGTGSIEFRQSNGSAEFIKGDTDDDSGQYIRQGQLLHRVFASIAHADDVDQVVERLHFEGLFESEQQKERVRRLAKHALKQPQALEWFSPDWDLYNECSIIYTDEQGELQTRRPDRVMMNHEKVVVVDFKFGKKKDIYTLQVKEYMRLMHQMGYAHVEGYLWFVYTDEIEPVDA